MASKSTWHRSARRSEAALGDRQERVVFADGSERLTYGAVVFTTDEARKVAADEAP